MNKRETQTFCSREKTELVGWDMSKAERNESAQSFAFKAVVQYWKSGSNGMYWRKRNSKASAYSLSSILRLSFDELRNFNFYLNWHLCKGLKKVFSPLVLHKSPIVYHLISTPTPRKPIASQIWIFNKNKCQKRMKNALS